MCYALLLNLFLTTIAGVQERFALALCHVVQDAGGWAMVIFLSNYCLSYKKIDVHHVRSKQRSASLAGLATCVATVCTCSHCSPPLYLGFDSNICGPKPAWCIKNVVFTRPSIDGPPFQDRAGPRSEPHGLPPFGSSYGAIWAFRLALCGLLSWRESPGGGARVRSIGTNARTGPGKCSKSTSNLDETW